jgi:predicted XRE-type DNA-binding protein
MRKGLKGVPFVDEGSGNVFTDVGLEMSDTDMLKVCLALAINRTIQKKKITQAEAGEKMGVDQAKVSKIVRGRLDEFSPERLIQCLLLLGRDIEVFVSDRYRSKPGRLRVRACS